MPPALECQSLPRLVRQVYNHPLKALSNGKFRQIPAYALAEDAEMLVEEVIIHRRSAAHQGPVFCEQRHPPELAGDDEPGDGRPGPLGKRADFLIPTTS